MPGKSHGQRSLAGYSPWDWKESDTTEPVTHTHALRERISDLETRVSSFSKYSVFGVLEIVQAQSPVGKASVYNCIHCGVNSQSEH